MKLYSQTEVFNFLKQNPYEVKVHVGDLEDMGNQDYIFLAYLYDNAIPSDNKAVYKSTINISVASKDLDMCRALVKYIRSEFVCAVTYSHSEEHEYYLATMETVILLKDE